MPIRPENKHRYPPNWKTEIRPAILRRAGNKCEWCGLLNYAVGYRTPEGQFVPATAPDGQPIVGSTYKDARRWQHQVGEWDGEGRRYVIIVLTVAHVHDDNPANCTPENLAALCQQCHNRHDAKSRAAGIRQRRHAGQYCMSLKGEADND